MPIATKLGNMVTYREGHPPIKLPGTLITWSCEITQKTRNMSITGISMVTKRHMVLIYNEKLSFIKSHVPLITWSCDKSEKYLHFHNAYVNLHFYHTNIYQIGEGGNLRWGLPLIKSSNH